MDDQKNKVQVNIMFSKRWLGLLLITTLIIGSYQYYIYSKSQLEKHLLESRDTMFGINATRFSFKVVTMTERGNHTLLQALRTKDEEKFYDALDYFEAAQGYALTEHLVDEKVAKQVSEKLEGIYQTVSSLGFDITQSEMDSIYRVILEIEKDMEMHEQLIWADVQQDYINFQENEYKVNSLYQYVIIIITIVLIFFILILISERKLNNTISKQKEELKSLAYFDTLTGIPNRKSIESIITENIVHCQRNEGEFYIALIDLDNFKKINDMYGHDSGDALLVECVKLVEGSMRSLDIMGRFGGDEFIIVFKDISHYSQLVIILNRILESFKASINIGQVEYFTNISMGIAHYPADGKDSSELIKHADIAMYNAKAEGKGRYSFFESSLSNKIKRQYALEPQIKTALEEGQFELYYQPQIDALTGTLTSVEALVRWNHPQDGFVAPGYFIDVIENGYMTREFGEWVIMQASKQQKEWLTKGIDVSVSVNLSVKHIMDPDFYEDLMNLVSDLDINLEKFYFEITEYELLKEKERSLKVLNDLAMKGVKFHLDDYGTGYSSITYLNDLQIKALKIDKSFVDKITNIDQHFPFVDAIINMAKCLDIVIIAEGVESEIQQKYLSEMGCDILQGYYYSKPLSADNFELYNKNYSIDLESYFSS